ncbi:hypothetical protein [Ralstonia solanacearum]|uniref:hypothetical protein n=1 Tax=Ralstonia solanacearum TaxID=305 RepID=UPI000F60971C|nr:hypothetical protein [Ralstonia solanacearum]MCL9845556.1 hypothetical protein [Ralstonia solanacearum]MCL9850368.1 hypothetical protein [Ralstonia solanacearum]MCL9855147.1 hypothetical protein [Ralstonia solanacearum]MCL9860194.1 hypothetical protein [Ralstonia solanacearum]MCL9865058.1 hypothetical protein [Ralstonia solanacearum]
MVLTSGVVFAKRDAPDSEAFFKLRLRLQPFASRAAFFHPWVFLHSVERPDAPVALAKPPAASLAIALRLVVSRQGQGALTGRGHGSTTGAPKGRWRWRADPRRHPAPDFD